MSMPTDSQPTDDALYFANSVNLFDASEDPTGGPSGRNALPDFNHQIRPTFAQQPVKRRVTSLAPQLAKGRQL